MMTYEFAEKKIEEIYEENLDHLKRLRKMVEPNPDWVDLTTWFTIMDGCVNEFSAASNTVIEIYIELSNGECKDWKDLHKLKCDLSEKLKTEVSKNKDEIERPF